MYTVIWTYFPIWCDVCLHLIHTHTHIYPPYLVNTDCVVVIALYMRWKKETVRWSAYIFIASKIHHKFGRWNEKLSTITHKLLNSSSHLLLLRRISQNSKNEAKMATITMKTHKHIHYITRTHIHLVISVSINLAPFHFIGLFNFDILIWWQ